MSRPVLAALVVFAPSILAACGNDAASTSTGAASAARTAAPPVTAAPKPTPAPAATTAAPAAGGACSFNGTWTGNYPPGPYPFSGTPFEFTFNADGTGKTHSQRADQDFAWKVEGGSFDIHGVKVEKGGRFTCGKDEVGKWSYTFTPDCNSVAFKVVQDPCKGRARMVSEGLSMKRK